MASIEDIKEQFNKSLQKNEPEKNTNSIKKYFLIGLVLVISGAVLNYYYVNNKSYQTEYTHPDVKDVAKIQKEEDQDPLFQKF